MTPEPLTREEIEWVQRLKRLGMGYFRPLLMAFLMKYSDPVQRIDALKAIERFVFVVFRLTEARSHYGRSEFSNAVREIGRGRMKLAELKERLRNRMRWAFTEEGCLAGDFHRLLQKKFEDGQGYYHWSGLKYFLYEYELELLSRGRQKKVDWTDLLKTRRDRISIEHIYPQAATTGWPAFEGLGERERGAYCNSLGNLLLLSSAVNSSLQNDAFAEKKEPRFRSDRAKRRNGYADGSHSEIEVAQCEDWGPDEIRERGIRLLEFMEKRWSIRFADEQAREELLFVGTAGREGSR